MIKTNHLKSSQFPENIEYISEVFYLLNFFSKTSIEQWEIVPEKFTPVWVETYQVQCNVYNPILFLVCMLMKNIEDGEIMEEPYRYYNFKEKIINILEEEIYPLIAYWLIDAYGHRDFIFEKEGEITGPGKIWLVLSRLCQIALSFEDWSKYEIKELSFEYFLKYSYPYDPV